MKNFSNFALLLALVSNGAYALDGLKNWGSKIGKKSTTSSSSSQSSIVTTGDSVQPVDVNCDKTDQTFIPYSELLDLMQHHKLEINHDPKTGEIEVDGGLMVGNCNSMLKTPVIQKPINGKPYLFFVEIQKPAKCLKDEDTCFYELEEYADFATPGAKPTKRLVNVAPNFEGFKECLRQSGALDNNHKIVTKTFNHKQDGITQTEELAFYSKGPFAKTHGTKYGEIDGREAGKCETFEKFTSEGIDLISRADQLAIQENERVTALRQRQHSAFVQLCNNGSLEELRSGRSQFVGTDLASDFDRIYRKSLLEAVTGLHENFKKPSLADIDVEEFSNIISEFDSEIIAPLNDAIASLVNSQTGKSSEVRAEIQKVIDEKVAELRVLTSAPYLTREDYKKAQSFVAKAPLEKKLWREATLDFFKTRNAAFYYAQYDSKNKEPVLTPSSVEKERKSDIAIESAYIDKLGILAENPKRSIAGDYKREISLLQQKQAQAAQATDTFIENEKAFLYKNCVSPTISTYYSGDCQAAQANIGVPVIGTDGKQVKGPYGTPLYQGGATELSNQYAQSLNPDISRNYSLYNQWAQIEASRNGAPVAQTNVRDIPTNFQQQRFTLPNQRQQTQNGQGQVQQFPTQRNGVYTFNNSGSVNPNLQTQNFNPSFQTQSFNPSFQTQNFNPSFQTQAFNPNFQTQGFNASLQAQNASSNFQNPSFQSQSLPGLNTFYQNNNQAFPQSTIQQNGPLDSYIINRNQYNLQNQTPVFNNGQVRSVSGQQIYNGYPQTYR